LLATSDSNQAADTHIKRYTAHAFTKRILTNSSLWTVKNDYQLGCRRKSNIPTSKAITKSNVTFLCFHQESCAVLFLLQMFY